MGIDVADAAERGASLLRGRPARDAAFRGEFLRDRNIVRSRRGHRRSQRILGGGPKSAGCGQPTQGGKQQDGGKILFHRFSAVIEGKSAVNDNLKFDGKNRKGYLNSDRNTSIACFTS